MSSAKTESPALLAIFVTVLVVTVTVSSYLTIRGYLRRRRFYAELETRRSRPLERFGPRPKIWETWLDRQRHIIIHWDQAKPICCSVSPKETPPAALNLPPPMTSTSFFATLIQNNPNQTRSPYPQSTRSSTEIENLEVAIFIEMPTPRHQSWHCSSNGKIAEKSLNDLVIGRTEVRIAPQLRESQNP